MIQSNLRGELTVHIDRKFEDLELIRTVAQTLRLSSSDEMEALRQALYPAIVCSLAANGELDNLIKLEKSGADLSTPDYDQRTPLHLATANSHSHIVEFL